MIRAKYDSRKQPLCCVSFKLRLNYFIYLIYQLLLVDVNLGYMHLYTKYGVWSKRRQVKTATNQNGYRSKVNV